MDLRILNDIIDIHNKYSLNGSTPIVFYNCSEKLILDLRQKYKFILSSIIEDNNVIVFDYDRYTFPTPDKFYNFILKEHVGVTSYHHHFINYMKEQYDIVYNNYLIKVIIEDNNTWIYIDNVGIEFPLKEITDINVFNLAVKFLETLYEE